MSLKDDLEQLKAESDPRIVELQKALSNAQKQNASLKDKNARLVEATHLGAYEAMLSMGKVPPVPVPKKDKRTAKPEVALIHSTDWQGSKVTVSYNSEIMRERVMQLSLIHI
mgnify:CR=1 FL=1